MKLLILQIVVIALPAAASAAALLSTDCPYAAVAVLGVALAALVWIAVASLRRTLGKFRLVLEAMRNNDFTMRFPGAGERDINRLLADLSGIIKGIREESKRHEVYYRLIIEQVNAGIFALDQDGNVRLCNGYALRLFGLSVFTNVAQIDRIDSDLKQKLLAMQPGDTLIQEFRLGEEDVSVSVGMSVVEQRGGRVRLYVMNNIHTALDRKEVEAWINLTRVLTHEIMNSVAPIHALSDGLLQGDSSAMDERTKEKIGVIRNTASDLMCFTEAYRKFSAIPRPQRKLVYVSEMVDETTALLKDSLSGVELTVDVRPSDLIANADRMLLNRAIVNLLQNAVEADASHVAVRAFADGNDAVVIEISDDGIPVPRECRDRIFVPFFTTKSSGSGIGLAATRRIAMLHDGSISLIQPVGDGFTKTFRITLP